MIVLFEISTTIAITILGIIVPIFVFATTLLGSASKRVRAEEDKAKDQDKKDFDKDITELQTKIDEAKKSGPTIELNKRMKELINNREKFDKQLRQIQTKYDSIKFKGIVIYPGFFMLLAIISSIGAKIYFNYNLSLAIFYWILYLILLIIGIKKLCISLLTIQEVAVSSDELRIKEQADCFIKALKQHDESKAEKLEINFVNVTFPYKCAVTTEIVLNFRARLIQGKIVNNVAVWFFVPDGFDIIEPNYFWRQGQDFTRAPNIRTVKVRIGDLSIGPYTPATFKIKTPSDSGKYTLMYSLKGDGYNGQIEDAIIEVE